MNGQGSRPGADCPTDVSRDGGGLKLILRLSLIRVSQDGLRGDLLRGRQAAFIHLTLTWWKKQVPRIFLSFVFAIFISVRG